MRHAMCGWGNCMEELTKDSPFKITCTISTLSGREQRVFCCYDHAALDMAESHAERNGREASAAAPPPS